MARRQKQKQLDTAIEELDFDTVLEYASKHRLKKSAYSFHNEFKNLSETNTAKTIKNLCTLVLKCMENFLAENASGAMASSNTNICNMAGKLIQVAVDIAIVSFQYSQLKCHVEIAVLLNNVLPTIPENLDGVKNAIAQYCEKLCLADFSEKSEYFLYNVFLYLFKKTTGKRVLKADIKRKYAIRKKLGAVMELKETKKDEIWELIKKCATSVTYVSVPEGQKIISLAMSLDIDKITEIHDAIRKTLSGIPIKYAVSYGRIYFGAWLCCSKSGNDAIRNVIEITCLQDFIVTAIRSGRKPIIPVMRKILAQFHIHRKDQVVSKMLYCLYQPLLWRFLKNPDGMIRANATTLFLDIFPLEDPEIRVVATDLELNDQLLMIRDLLLDDFPIVRITTVIGICISMSVNWEVYPEEMLKSYFRIMVNDLSRDSSTAEVRVAVVKGLKCLLENPLTRRCLNLLLPKMSHLLHDISDNVRIAFCQLLLKVKTIATIKYFRICAANQLLAQLQDDCHAVKKAITNLLNNSYFPKQTDPKIWLGRVLELVKTERNSARVFFSYVEKFIGADASVRFMIQATRAVHLYVKTKNSPVSVAMELCDKENILNMNDYLSSLEQAVGFSNLKVVSTLLDCVTVLWLSLKMHIDEPKNKYLLKLLVAKISHALADLCLYYKDSEAWQSVFYLSSFLPSSDVPSLGSLCFWKLKNLPLDAKPDDFMTLVECLCNQRQSYELLHLLKEWIEIGLSDSYVPPSAKKRRKRKSSESVFQDQPKPFLANQILHWLIIHRSLQKAILPQVQVIKEIMYLIDHVKRKLERFNAKLISEAEASFLGLLFTNIIQLAVLLHDEKPGDIQFVVEMVEWTDKTLVQHLKSSDETENHFLSLVVTICQSLAQVVGDVTALGFCEPNNQTYITYFDNLLHSELGPKFALIFSKFLYKHVASGMFLYRFNEDTTMLENLLNILCKAFDHFSDEKILQSIPQYDSIPNLLGNVMQVVNSLMTTPLSEAATEAFRSVLTHILNSLLVKTKDIVEELDDDPFNKMVFPKVGAFYMTILNLKPKLYPRYIKILTKMFVSSEKDMPVWIATWAIVHNILNKKSEMTKPIVREANLLVHKLGKTLYEIYPIKKNSDEENLEEHAESPRMQIFQQHCHSEFLKLKSSLTSLVSTLKEQPKKSSSRKN